MPGATYERLHLPLDASAWDVTFEADDDGGALWHYRARPDAVAARSPVDAFTATAMPRSRAPFPARELPGRIHAVVATQAPDVMLNIVHSDARDGRYRAAYVMAAPHAGIGGIVQDGIDALHAIEIELHADAPASERAL